MRRLTNLVGVGVWLVILLGVAFSASAQVVRSFTPRFTATERGDIVFVSNTLLTCSTDIALPGVDNPASCATAQGGAGTLINNNFTMVWVDDDADVTTFNSSRAQLTIPPGGTVLFAGLYWGADTSKGTGTSILATAAPTPANRGVVRFATPASGGYLNITSRSNPAVTTPSVDASGSRFSAFADVTTLVQGAGSGTYAVANIQAGKGQDRFAGWSLVVAYRDPAQPLRNLSVFDGYAIVNTGATVAFTVSGFITPPAPATVTTRVGVVGYEGDRTIGGDSFQLNSTCLGDALNPSGSGATCATGADFFNSTITRLGAHVATKSPNYVNQLGFDADIINANGVLPNGATSATITLRSSGETYLPAVVTFATDIFEPIIDDNFTKTVADITGGNFNPGDVLEYTINVANTGNDPAINAVLSDPIPVNTTYAPGSLRITSGPGSGTKTDVAGDDTAEFDTGLNRVVFRLGTGATPVAGGTLVTGAATSIAFRVTINPATASGTIVLNQSSLAYISQSTGVSRTSLSDGDLTTDGSQATAATVQGLANLSITKTGPATIAAGSAITYTTTIQNAGPSSATNVVVSDPTPAGMTFINNQGACAGAFPCPLGTVSSGQTVTITSTFNVPGNYAGPATASNTASVSSPTPDSDLANNTATATTAVARVADLALAKSVNPSLVTVGNTVTFVVTLSNLGPSDATTVIITDLLPVGLTFVSATPSAGTYVSGTGAWSLASVPSGSAATLTMLATVVQAGTLTNIATRTAVDQTDPVSGNNSAQAVVNQQSADVRVAKTVNITAPLPGDVVTFTVTATNLGPQPATGLQVTDALPLGLVFVSATPSQGAYAPSTGLWNVGALALNATATLQIQARVQPSAAGPVANAATKTAGDVFDPNPANNSSAVTLDVVPTADLQVQKTVSNNSPNVGSTVTYTLTVRNAGPASATGVVLRDILPASLVFSTAVPSQGAYSSATNRWTVGTVASGNTAALTVSAFVTSPGTTTNLASVAAVDQVDQNPTNNAAGATINGQQVDIHLVKVADRTTPALDEPITFTLTAVNNGPSAATGITITDLLPVGLMFVSATPSQGTYSNATGVWSVGSLGVAGPTATVTLAIVATAPAAGLVTNEATLTSVDQPDSNPMNDRATSTVEPRSVADLLMAKTVTTPVPSAGAPLSYVLSSTNTGPNAASDVGIQDAIPAGATFVSLVSSPGATCTSPAVGASGTISCVWSGATIPASARSLQLVVLPGAGLPAGTVISNTGTTSSQTFDPGPGSNSATALATLSLQSDLRITKTGPASLVLGQNIVYAIQVTNVGPSDATGVQVADPTPAGLTFVSNTGDCASAFPCSLGSLPAGAVRTITSTFNVPLTYPGTGSLVNTASVSSPLADPDATTNSSSASTLLIGVSDISLSKSVDILAPSVGQTVLFRVTTTNLGPSAATGVVVSDSLPAGLTLISATPSQGAYDASTGLWQIGAIPNGGAVVLDIAARADTPGGVTNVATKTAADQPDPDSSNNTAGAAVTAQPSADVQVLVTVSSPSAAAGEVVTFTVTLRNAGPNPATTVLTNLALPPGLTLGPITLSAGTYSPTTNEWLVGSLAPNGVVTLTVAAVVAATGPLTVTATKIAQTEFDPVAANNASGAVVNGLESDVQVVKTADAQFVAVGQRVRFTIATTNNGPGTATNVVVRDQLPASLSFVSAAASLGAYDSVAGVWNVGTLAAAGPGNVATLQIETVVVSSGMVSNTAEVSGGSGIDTNIGNNRGTVTLQSDVLDLQAGLTLTGVVGEVGSHVRFYPEITNVSAASSTGRITFTLTLPPEFEYLPGRPDGWTCALAGPTVSCFRDDLILGPGVRIAPIIDTVVRGVLAAPTWVNVMIANGADGNPANNLASLRVDATLVIDPADLGIAQMVTSGSPQIGETGVVSITMTNRGPDPASSMVSLHSLPEDISLVRVATNSGTCSGQRLITCLLGRVASQDTRQVTLLVRFDEPGVFRVVSSVAAPEDDPQLSDNQVSTPIVVGGLPPTGGSAPPFGFLDLPADGSVVQGAVAVGGWALDDVGVASVRLYRDPVATEAPDALVYLGEGLRIRGARPDVEQAFRALPESDRAGWGLLVLTNMLPNRGNGTFRLHAIAVDAGGQSTLLGSRTIVAENDRSTRPFGTIDTPAQGETISGSSYAHFGWALTPAPKTIPSDGSTIVIFIDGQAVGTVAYGHPRADIASLFPEYLNAAGAVGVRVLDTTTLADGLHTISWAVTDTAGVTEGLGSRYFRVDNPDVSNGLRAVSARGLVARTNPIDTQPYQIVAGEMSPIAVSLADLGSTTCTGARYGGEEQVASGARALPVGSTLDRARGIFTWQPGPGFVGRYRLVFTRHGCGVDEVLPVEVVLHRTER